MFAQHVDDFATELLVAASAGDENTTLKASHL